MERRQRHYTHRMFHSDLAFITTEAISERHLVQNSNQWHCAALHFKPCKCLRKARAIMPMSILTWLNAMPKSASIAELLIIYGGSQLTGQVKLSSAMHYQHSHLFRQMRKKRQKKMMKSITFWMKCSTRLCQDLLQCARLQGHQHHFLNLLQPKSSRNSLRTRFVAKLHQLSKHRFLDYSYNFDGMVVRAFFIDGAIQKVVPWSWKAGSLHAYHYPRLAGYYVERSMYDNMRREVYWPHMANDVYKIVKNCCKWAQNEAVKMSMPHLHVFSGSKSFELIATDLLSLLSTMSSGNHLVNLMTNQYSNLTWGVPTLGTSRKAIATIFYGSGIVLYGIPAYALTHNGAQFNSNFFETICNFLGLKHFTTTAYHPQSNGSAEWYRRTLFVRLRHHIAEHRPNWDILGQPLT